MVGVAAEPAFEAQGQAAAAVERAAEVVVGLAEERLQHADVVVRGVQRGFGQQGVREVAPGLLGDRGAQVGDDGGQVERAQHPAEPQRSRLPGGDRRVQPSGGLGGRLGDRSLAVQLLLAAPLGVAHEVTFALLTPYEIKMPVVLGSHKPVHFGHAVVVGGQPLGPLPGRTIGDRVGHRPLPPDRPLLEVVQLTGLAAVQFDDVPQARPVAGLNLAPGIPHRPRLGSAQLPLTLDVVAAHPLGELASLLQFPTLTPGQVGDLAFVALAQVPAGLGELGVLTCGFLAVLVLQALLDAALLQVLVVPLEVVQLLG